MIKVVSYVALSLAVSVCAPRGEDASPNDSPRPPFESDSVPVGTVDTAAAPVSAAAEFADSARGTVVVTGMGPSSYATLSSGTGPPMMLTGELEPELRQLAGARVDVFGEKTGGQRAAMRVTRYDVIEIDGERPLLGTVLPDGERVLVGSDTLVVVGHSETLPAGAGIWIIGRRDGMNIRLLSWGVIRRP